DLYPASLTKLMTIYLAFEAISKNKVSFDTQLRVSRKAARMPRSALGLRAGGTITMKEAIMSLIIKSANDSSVVIAEALAGSQEKFAKIMNIRAKQLGMNNTHFTNASGWHHPKQKTTTYDMAKLAIAIKRDFPTFYPLFMHESFFYKNNLIKSHNYVIKNLKGAQGLKTGYTSKAGWNIITSATRDGHNLIGVIMGGKSYQSRDLKMLNLMNSQFASLNIEKQKKRQHTSLYKVKKHRVSR
ncbi:MAG: D-alanyl-D-alanine carboxypeptidase, partial [Alphaproteobacteria bacterium]|nr:D-alanyl-D-alanine carboxypeptidase [Alphaproteobacteria bacterium]